MNEAITLSYIVTAFWSGFSTGIVLFIIGGFFLVKSGGAKTLANSIGS